MLIAVLDDATKRVRYAQLWPTDTTAAIATAWHAVTTADGLPMAVVPRPRALGRPRRGPSDR